MLGRQMIGKELLYELRQRTSIIAWQPFSAVALSVGSIAISNFWSVTMVQDGHAEAHRSVALRTLTFSRVEGDQAWPADGRIEKVGT